MDSRQSVIKMDFDENLLQNLDDNIPSMEEAKTYKPELDPLQIGHVLEKVFSFLDEKSIKKARQVDKFWSIEGAKMLISKCFVRIPWEEGITENELEMNKFKAFLSHKSKDVSMIKNITIEAAADVTLWKSLGVLGKQVKSVKMNNTDRQSDWLINILDLLPNLKYLSFKDWKGDWDLDTELRLLISLLTSTMSKAEKNRDPLVLSHMDLVFLRELNLDELGKFADCRNIKIEALKFEMCAYILWRDPKFSSPIANIISKLLFTSQKVLKRLIFNQCEVFLHLLEFPVMTALTHIDLDFCPECLDRLENCKFVPAFQFSETVPNLRKITITHRVFESTPDNFFSHLFEQTGTAPSVKILEFRGNCSNIDIDPLCKTFPNIEEFKLCRVACSRRMLQSVWKYGANIRNLHLHINLDKFIGGISELDSIFTGFSSETVEKMKQEQPNLGSYTLDKLDELRTEPSILNLKELDGLTIEFHGNNQNSLPDRFLAMAGNFGFSCLPNNPDIFIYFKNCRKTALKWEKSALAEVSDLPNITVEFQKVFRCGDHGYGCDHGYNDDDSSSDDE